MKLYMSVAEFQESTLAIGLASQIAALSQQQLCQLLSRASTRVDRFTRRKIGAPLATTIAASPVVSVGSTLIGLNSTLSLDNTDNQCLVLGSSGNYEIIPIVPGSVTTTTYSGNYPGTVQLATPTTYAHPTGETVQCAWQETHEVGSSSSIDVFTEAITQEAQIAAAHQPVLSGGNMTRVVYLDSYPIQQVVQVQGSYSYSDAYFPVALDGVILSPVDGFFLLPLGTPLYEGSFVQVTHISGYQAVPDDVKTATMWYAGEELMLTNAAYAQGMVRLTEGKVTQQWQPMTKKSVFAQNAENMLLEGNYKRRV